MDDAVNAGNENDTESTDSYELNALETEADIGMNLIDIEQPNEDALQILNPIENGRPSDDLDADDDEDDDDDDADDEEAQVAPQDCNFDLNLPASHSYLGSNLEELRGRTLLDEGIYMNLPLLMKHSILLFPGQTLPMAVFGTNVIDMLTKCIQKNRTFGVVCLQKDKLESIGTTAEIYEYMEGNREEGFRIKAKGRQRFQILRMIHGFNELSANVKIVPEITLPPPFYEQRLTSLDPQRVKPSSEDEPEKQEKIERLEAALTTWPSWVYKQFDPYKLAFKIRQLLHYIANKGSNIPTDPSDLSFWVAQNLPLNDHERIMLLKYDCAISRLQWELKYLTEDRALVCCKCEKTIGKQSDLFPMSKEGPQSTFCNANGFIFDTVTLYRAENLKLSNSSPSSICSWFPGYAWTIATCKGCEMHMGWLFTADTDKTLRPLSFWGLTRRGLKSKKLQKNMLEE